MQSIKPVIDRPVTDPEYVLPEITYREGQPEYAPLTVVRTDRAVMSRWRLSAEEREHIRRGGDLFICQLNFGGPLQPILPIAASQDEAVRLMIEVGEPL